MPVCPHCNESFEFGDGAEQSENTFRDSESVDRHQTDFSKFEGVGESSEGSDVHPFLDAIDDDADPMAMDHGRDLERPDVSERRGDVARW